jgi:two-component system, cell cycle sensor histidine kinase and response regulator CckA
MGGVFAVTSYFRIIETMHKEIAKHGVEVSKTFSQMVTPYIFESDYVTIIDNTDELIANGDIRSVAILDINGIPWLTTQPRQTKVSTKTPFYQDIIRNKTIGYRQVSADGQKSLELVNPITALGEVVYLLKLEISLESIKKEAVSRIREAMGICLIMTVVGTVLGGFLARLLLEPLHNLLQGTNEIAEGNLSHRIPLTSSDEIGVLSKSFNSMASSLENELSARKRMETDLKEQQQHLEKTVLARTAQLREKNARILEEVERHRTTVDALRESEERYRRFSEVTIDGIVFRDEGRIIDMNAAFRNIFGYSEEQLQGKTLQEAISLPKDTDSISDTFIETIGMQKDGATIHIEMLSRVLADNNKHLTVTSIRNINDRKLLETRLHQAQKMESIGLLAGGVAHDLNNILTGIVGYPEFLLMDLPEQSPMRKPLELIKDSGIKAAAVVSDLLTIARGAASVRELKNLNHLVGEYLSSPEHVRTQDKHPGVILVSDLQPDLWNMYCSPIHATKSIMNIISNAVEATGEQGEIVITTRNEYVHQSTGDKKNLKEGMYVVFSVSDSGPGICDEDIPHIFEPFFTRKTMGPTSGSGLGLTVVWNTVLDHEGAVFVDKNEPGLTFHMYFPATRACLKTDPLSADLNDLHGNGEQLLVVDDDERQRIICSQLLISLGYKVNTVASGEEAIEYLKTHTVDLLVLDMILGQGMNGRQTYSEVKKRLPDLPAIIVSGFSADSEIKEAQRAGAGRFVKKPYTINQLGTAIREILNIRGKN